MIVVVDARRWTLRSPSTDPWGFAGIQAGWGKSVGYGLMRLDAALDSNVPIVVPPAIGVGIAMKSGVTPHPMNAWYAQLSRPPLTPPNWIFGPVWTILYVMIALSITLYVRQTRSDPSIPAYILIGLHLASNVCWTPIFFRLQSPGWALLDIILLDITLCLLIVIFWRACRPASMLLWPYFGWVLFATYLNAGFFKLNPR